MDTTDKPDKAAHAPIDRRTFMKSLGFAGVALSLGGKALALTDSAELAAPKKFPDGPVRKRRYAIVGTGLRSTMFQKAIETEYAHAAEIVALCDTNPGRMEVVQETSKKNGAVVPPAYLAKDFDRMIAETKPDVVIVATVDSTHDEYLVRAMNAGCETISEKPMITTVEGCQKILDATARTGRACRVTFNYRYAPPRVQVKDILMSGEIGDILSVDFQWHLDTFHGADYFRRWHSQKQFSGGLLVHKATHHFDLVNWWLSALPVSVFATGKREFYTPTMAKRFGLDSHHERCLTCPEKAKCAFVLDLEKDSRLKRFYLDQENHDGYFRDRCVFRPEIDIEDTMNVMVSYDTGATLNYSLNAFSPLEGYTITFNGTKGRLEHAMLRHVHFNDAAPKRRQRGDVITTRVLPLRGPVKDYTPWEGKGEHGGGGPAMLSDIFSVNPLPDKYLCASDEHAAAWSCLVGVAANRCIETGKPVQIAKLVRGLKRPAFPSMPTRNEPVAMPPS